MQGAINNKEIFSCVAMNQFLWAQLYTSRCLFIISRSFNGNCFFLSYEVGNCITW